MSEPTGYISPDDAGRWDGNVFHFDPPIVQYDQNQQPHEIRKVDFTSINLQDGITRSDIIHALLNPAGEGQPE